MLELLRVTQKELHYNMLSFGPCGAGLRKDCMKQVCLARHIDDLQQSYEKKKRIPTDKQSKYSKLRKGYSTRSLTKVENLRDVNNKKADSRKKTRSFNLSTIDVAKDANIYSFEQ